MSINKLRQQRAACEFGLIEKVLQKSEVGIKAFDLEISERALRLSRRAGKGRATTVGDDFGQQRIITGAGLIASVGKAVNPDPEACGWCVVGDYSPGTESQSPLLAGPRSGSNRQGLHHQQLLIAGPPNQVL